MAQSKYEKIAKKLGGSILSKTGHVRFWIDTGNLALNYACSGKFVGGGIPGGKVIEIFGGSSTCKTLFANNILHGCQKRGGWAVFQDAENSLNSVFAETSSHINTDELIVLYPDHLQDGFSKMHSIMNEIREEDKENPIAIVYDSLAASPSKKELAETEDPDGEHKDIPGERAKICSKELRKLTPVLEVKNTCCIFLNQLRQKIGVMFGDPSVTTTGVSMEYYASLRLRTKAEKKLKDKLGNIIGMGVSVQNIKNKCFKPFITIKNMQLFYDQGINPLSGLLDILIQIGRVENCGKGSYKINEPWAGGKEIKFRSKLERNDIPPEALLAAPKVVDAEEPAQIQEYLNIFGAALHAADNDVDKEEDVKDEE